MKNLFASRTTKTFGSKFAALGIATLVVIFFLSGTVQSNAQLISVKTGGGIYGFPILPMSGAAVVGSSGDIWNNYGAYDRNAPHSLLDTKGNPTGVTLTYSDYEGYSVTNGFSPTSYANLMTQFISTVDKIGQTTTLAGLDVDLKFDLYLYAQGDVDGRQTIFTINGVSQTATSNAVDSTFIEGQSYVKFSNLSTDELGTISISWVNGVSREGDFNGFQLMAVPEPHTAALILGGLGLTLVLKNLRRKNLTA